MLGQTLADKIVSFTMQPDEPGPTLRAVARGISRKRRIRYGWIDEIDCFQPLSNRYQRRRSGVGPARGVGCPIPCPDEKDRRAALLPASKHSGPYQHYHAPTVEEADTSYELRRRRNDFRSTSV
jgi:hypothetical protein